MFRMIFRSERGYEDGGDGDGDVDDGNDDGVDDDDDGDDGDDDGDDDVDGGDDDSDDGRLAHESEAAYAMPAAISMALPMPFAEVGFWCFDQTYWNPIIFSSPYPGTVPQATPYHASPCPTMPRDALPCLTVPYRDLAVSARLGKARLGSARLVTPYHASPCPTMPRHALPCLTVPYRDLAVSARLGKARLGSARLGWAWLAGWARGAGAALTSRRGRRPHWPNLAAATGDSVSPARPSKPGAGGGRIPPS